MKKLKYILLIFILTFSVSAQKENKFFDEILVDVSQSTDLNYIRPGISVGFSNIIGKNDNRHFLYSMKYNYLRNYNDTILDLYGVNYFYDIEHSYHFIEQAINFRILLNNKIHFQVGVSMDLNIVSRSKGWYHQQVSTKWGIEPPKELFSKDHQLLNSGLILFSSNVAIGINLIDSDFKLDLSPRYKFMFVDLNQNDNMDLRDKHYIFLSIIFSK